MLFCIALFKYIMEVQKLHIFPALCKPYTFIRQEKKKDKKKTIYLEIMEQFKIRDHLKSQQLRMLLHKPKNMPVFFE